MKEEMISTAIEVIKDSSGYVIKQTYNDGLKNPIIEIGKGLSSILKIGFFPFNWIANKVDHFLKETNSKINNIDPDSIQEPDQSIIGPAIEGLRYTMNNDELREMFSNLIANSFDKKFNFKIHPSYSSIISKMNSLDALLLKEVSKYIDDICILNVKMADGKSMSTAFPSFYSEIKISNYLDEDLVGSFERLQSYGLISINMLSSLNNKEKYISIKNNPDLINKIDLVSKAHQNYKIAYREGLIEVSKFGKDFIECCVK